MKYNRILLKLSGEALMGNKQFGIDHDLLSQYALEIKGIVDAVNITDNQTAVVRMSSWGAALVAIQEGLEPNYQMVCRDRNRIAMQSGILGA